MEFVKLKEVLGLFRGTIKICPLSWEEQSCVIYRATELKTVDEIEKILHLPLAYSRMLLDSTIRDIKTIYNGVECITIINLNF